MELAELAGAGEVMPLLGQSLQEERVMADWLGNNIRLVTRQYVQERQQRDQAA
jgi:ferritin-like metal-binding protein YciE